MSYQVFYQEKKKRSVRRINRKFVLLLIAFLALSALCLNLFNLRLDPGEVVIRWHEAMHDGDIETAERYTSATATSYIVDQFGSMTAFSTVYYTRQSRGNAYLVDTHISGQVATVVSISCYEDGTQREWEDILFLEDGIWKVAPQYVVVRPARSSAC